MIDPPTGYGSLAAEPSRGSLQPARSQNCISTLRQKAATSAITHSPPLLDGLGASWTRYSFPLENRGPRDLPHASPASAHRTLYAQAGESGA